VSDEREWRSGGWKMRVDKGMGLGEGKNGGGGWTGRRKEDREWRWGDLGIKY